MGQPIYVSDRIEWFFGQDGRDGFVDFIMSLDLLIGRKRIIWSGIVTHANTM
jgi:hypothetical protein